MPTRWLTVKPGRLWGHMQGQAGRGVQARGCWVQLLLQGAVHITLPWDVLNFVVSFGRWAKEGAFAPLAVVFLFLFPSNLTWDCCSSGPLWDGIYCHL